MTRLPEIRTAPSADIEIPVEVEGLYELAYNLWWTWSSRAHLLFNSIDPAAWRHYHNPVELLINVEPSRWEDLVENETFMTSYHTVMSAFREYRDGAEEAWFNRTHPGYEGGPVAYVSPEFGWHESLGTYSGGLGVLAGDHCKSASDEGLPFVGVGLLYKRGYFHQTIDADGQQQHFYPTYDPNRLPLRPVVTPSGRPVRVGIPLPGRSVHVRVWRVDVGRVPVLLLDSDVIQNDPADRPITSILYVRGREMRLCQEIVLGIGAVEVLRRLGIAPAVWHMNEGHSAFLSLQRLRRLMEEEGLSWDAALERVASNTIFTTHTPVPAGNESFSVGRVERYLQEWARGLDLPVDRALGLGEARPHEPDGRFNLTALSIRTSALVNGVSEIHGEVASGMWRHLWPEPERTALPIRHITNGVHTPTWMGPEMGALLKKHVGLDLFRRMHGPEFAAAVLAIPDEEMWEAHQAQKSRLLTFTRRRMLNQLARHGRSPEALRAVEQLLDPNALTVGFARRFATYKRASLVFRDPERLRSILFDERRPVQMLFAGKAHPADRPGQALIQRIFQASVSSSLSGRIVFLEDYDMQVGRHLVQGVDLWLNNPVRPKEASGTSGQKVAVNGALNFSVLDGWWNEGYEPGVGWAIGGSGETPHQGDDADAADAASLYETLGGAIASCYYERDEAGLPREWIARMKRSVAELAPRFSTARMVREYTEECYLPLARREADEHRASAVR